MKSVVSQVFTVFVLLSVGQLGVAQTGETGGSSKAESPSGAANVRAGTKINAQLESAVDARTAKPGQEVAARVTNDVKQDGQVVIHKGDRLMGHVTSVEASDKANAGSRMSVDFDRVASRQTTSQLNTVVTSVFSARGGSASEELMPAGPTMTAPPSRGGSSAAGGGGLAGGLADGLTSTVGSTVGVAGSAVGNLGGTLDAAGQTTVGTAAGAAANPIRVESRGRADQEAGLGSTLSTRQGDLRLESGTRMQFEVMAQGESKNQK